MAWPPPGGYSKAMSETHAATIAPPAPARRRGDAMRASIIAAARIEFAAKGYAGASMRSIARAIGVQIAHIQHHFGDKQGLWEAVLADVIGLQAAVTLRICEDEAHRPAHEVLALVVESLVRYAAATPHFTALMSQARTSPLAEESRGYRVEVGAGLDRITRLIATAQADGRFVPGNPTILFYQLVGAALRLFTVAADAIVILGQAPDTPEVMDEHIRTCLAIFMPNPHSRSGPDD